MGSKPPNDEVDNTKALRDSNLTSAEAAMKTKQSRKRTKTGCLTCRHRRIKCGEERPVCGNCIKSRRHCESYSQRAILRPSQYNHAPMAHRGAHIAFQAGPGSWLPPPYQAAYLGNGFDSTPFADLRPRQAEHSHPVLQDTMNTIQHQQQRPHGPTFDQCGPPSLVQPTPSKAIYQQLQPGNTAISQQSFHLRETHVSEAQYPCGEDLHVASHPYPLTVPVTPPPHLPMRYPATTQYHLPMVASSTAPQHIPHMVLPSVPQYHSEEATHYASSAPPVHTTGYEGSVFVPTSSYGLPYGYERQLPIEYPTPEVAAPHSCTSNGQASCPDLGYPLDYQQVSCLSQQPHAPPYATFGPPPKCLAELPSLYDELERIMLPPLTSPHNLPDAAGEAFDDDDYDVGSDNVDNHMTGSIYHNGRQKLGHNLNQNQIALQDLLSRRYDAFTHEGLVKQYVVEQHANPHRNTAVARVFSHFITATGPCLSMFERRPPKTSDHFTETHVPSLKERFWTHTMPMAAFHHQGLLHSMLALASLQIARLTGASTTPSMQHYAWALEHVHHCIGHPKKRLKITTIATLMLLGFYETMTAVHMTSDLHLAGTRMLFVGIDFVTMTRQARRMKRERVAQQQLSQICGPSVPGSGYEPVLDESSALTTILSATWSAKK